MKINSSFEIFMYFCASLLVIIAFGAWNKVGGNILVVSSDWSKNGYCSAENNGQASNYIKRHISIIKTMKVLFPSLATEKIYDLDVVFDYIMLSQIDESKNSNYKEKVMYLLARHDYSNTYSGYYSYISQRNCRLVKQH